jgi:hypothetical protein
MQNFLFFIISKVHPYPLQNSGLMLIYGRKMGKIPMIYLIGEKVIKG